VESLVHLQASTLRSDRGCLRWTEQSLKKASTCPNCRRADVERYT
jgi:hypothetical protein